MKFCSDCAAPVKSEIPTHDDRERFVCTSCAIIHYKNPLNVVGILPVKEDKILLCKRAIEPRFGYWTIPSGFMENGETVEDGAKREAMEEAGIKVNIDRLFMMSSLTEINQVYLLFLAEVVEENLGYGHETSEVKWVNINDIDVDSLAFKPVREAVGKYIAQYKSVI